MEDYTSKPFTKKDAKIKKSRGYHLNKAKRTIPTLIGIVITAIVVTTVLSIVILKPVNIENTMTFTIDKSEYEISERIVYVPEKVNSSLAPLSGVINFNTPGSMGSILAGPYGEVRGTTIVHGDLIIDVGVKVENDYLNNEYIIKLDTGQIVVVDHSKLTTLR